MPSASAMAMRAIQTWPKRVLVSRVVTAPLPKTSRSDWPLTSTATSNSQTTAETNKTARLLQARALICRSRRSRHAFAPAPRNAGTATHSRNSSAPAAAALAATCTARTGISASTTASCCPPLLPDPEAKAAFGPMGVDREHAPMDPVAPGRQRFDRNMDLRAGDAGAPVDARTRGVGDLRRAERGLELLGKPQRDRARCRAHRAADGRTGVIELRVRVRGRASHEHERQREEQQLAGHDRPHGFDAEAVLNNGRPIVVGKMSSR